MSASLAHFYIVFVTVNPAAGCCGSHRYASSPNPWVFLTFTTILRYMC
jgi:hypothetical protein